jgi:uroporphyrinogen-III synthase
LRRLVVIRPQPDADRSVAAARQLGLEAVAMPLFEVRPVRWSVPEREGYCGLVATSANAFRHGGRGLDRLRHLAVHAVGPATAEAARKAGFSVALVGQGGARDLEEQLPEGRFLHLAGADHVPIDRAEPVIVYESRAIAAPSADHLAGTVVAVHSPRAGERLAALVTDRASIAIAAISERAAAACGNGWERVAVADSPREDALLALAGKLCQNQSE